jgi:hypothetical protein
MMLNHSPHRPVKIPIAFLVLSLTALHAGEPALGLLDKKIELPQSLLDSTKPESASVPMISMPVGVNSNSPRDASPKKYASKMPVLVPKADLDPKFVKAPDSTIDYKLIIKSPEVASGK